MEEIRQAVKSSGTILTILGIIAIVLGIMAMLAPIFTGISVIILLGYLVLAGGIIRLIGVFRAENRGKGLSKFTNSVLTIICGIVLIANPLLTTGVITVLLALYFVSDGIFEVAAGVSLRPAEGWGWLLFVGIISIILGFMIWRQFPLSGAWAMGIFIGIKMFFVGLIMLKGGTALKLIVKA